MDMPQTVDIEHFLDFQTDVIDTDYDVSRRLADLQAWQAAWNNKAETMRQRIYELNGELRHTKEKRVVHQLERKIALIAVQMKRYEVQKIQRPLALSTAALEADGSQGIWKCLARQYTRMDKVSRKLWMFNNCYFLETTDMRSLVQKFKGIMKSTSPGEQRNSLVGGESGNGKTRLLNWLTSLHPPMVMDTYNLVPVVCTEAFDDDKSTKSILQQAILSCGDNYVDSDTVPELFDKWGRCAQVCKVLLLLVDELNHLREGVQRRRLLEITNRSQVSIIGTAVNPLKFREGDEEIASRFNDFYKIEPYTGDRLIQLLSLIDLIVPLPQRSYLGSRVLKVLRQGKSQEIEGAAPLIERKTKGSLRNIMRLILDAVESAIDRDLPTITPQHLEETWNNIQSSDPDDDSGGSIPADQA